MLGNTKTRLLYSGLIAAALAWGAPAANAAEETLPGHVSGWTARAVKIGAADDNATTTIAVHMTLKNVEGLKKVVSEVSAPGSERYGQYVSPSAFAMRYAPDKKDVAAVEAMLKAAGMTEITVGPHGAYVTATATVKQITSTFKVSQNLYSHDGAALRANAEEPTIPSALAGKVLYIQGLDELASMHKPLHHSAVMGELVAPASVKSEGRSSSALAPDAAASGASAAVTAPPVAANLPSAYCDTYYGDLVATLSTAADPYGASIPWLICGYTPQQIQAAYGLNKVKFDGTGVTVAITDAYASPTLATDLARYSKNHGLPKPTAANFQQIIPIGIYDVPAAEVTNAYGWWGEQSLDVAAVHGAAPGAKIVYIGSRDNNTSLDIALINAAYSHLGDVITNSWSNNGEAVAPGSVAMFDQALMAGAAQGVSVLFSSGDDGDLAVLNGAGTGAFPATSSYATGVGGTSLLLKNAKGAKEEYGWGNYRSFLNGVVVNSGKSVTTTGLATTTAFGVTFPAFTFYAGAGGGISLLETQPDYQAGVVPDSLATTLNLASGYTNPVATKQRVSPDASMVADPYTGYLYGETFTIAGDPAADAGCKPISATQEYCETPIGGTSLASPLLAGVIAVMNQKRIAEGNPVVGFANPLFYSYGSGPTLTGAGLNQIKAPTSPVSLLRGYVNNLNKMRVVTINSVPTNFITAPYGLEVCGYDICEGLNDVFNYTSDAQDWAHGITTPRGYNDVVGLGVPWVPKLVNEE